MLLQLCESKHPKWTREKILEKYWYMDAAGRYCYALPNKREVRVKFLTDTLCVDYFPVKTNVNPYIDIDYVESRSENRKISNATGVYRAIWNRQEGKCYYCGRRILRDKEKTLVEVGASQTKMVARNAYVRKRCLDCSVDFIDTDQPPSSITDIVLQLLSYVAQTEREFNHQRQAEGIAAARARGVHFGRKRKDRGENYESVAAAWREGKISGRAAAKELGIVHETFRRWVQEGKTSHNPWVMSHTK